MILSPQLSSYLFTLGSEMTNIVKGFTYGVDRAVYEGAPDAENDARLRESYKKATDAVRVWVSAVLAVEVIESRRAVAAGAQLFLPDSLLEAQVCVSETPYGGTGVAAQNTMLTTPVGRIDYAVYKAVIETTNNPVQELYRHFRKLIRQMHMAVPDGRGDLLTGGLLEANGIVDVLGVHNFDALWSGVDGFLDGKLLGSGVS